MSGLPAGAYALALSCLPGIGPVSLGQVLAGGDPEDAWAGVLAGQWRRPPGHRDRASSHRIGWDAAAGSIDPAGLWMAARRSGIGVTWVGCADYPAALRADPSPPAVLFWRGSLEALAGPCVALVGTRHATAAGRASAFELGRDLAAAGVCVVSGLALGIDGASHLGALAARRRKATVGVAASGVDHPYPARHRDLWERVVGSGAVVSETPPGWPAQTWRFPARNRIIAGLVSVVVVVESHAAGGSLLTAEAALQRGVEVLAVPGPIRSPASEGTNQLLYDGAGPVRDATDVLIALGSAVAGAPRLPPHSSRLAVPPDGRNRPAASPRPGPAHDDPASVSSPSPQEGEEPTRPTRAAAASPAPGGQRLTPGGAALLEVMGWQPRSLNWLVARHGGDLAGVAAALAALAAGGRASEERGWWQRLV